jgi:uncharacterized protein YqkB
MGEPTLTTTCPRCRSSEFVRWKLILIDAERDGCRCEGVFSIDRLNTTFLGADAGLEQFVRALYCEKCALGFLPDEMASSVPQRWRLTSDGWCPVNSDGSLGTPRERVS